MTNIITVGEVVNFMALSSGVADKNSQMLEDLIKKEQKNLETILRRSLTSQTVTNKIIYHNSGCKISGRNNDKMYLVGDLRDMYSVTSLIEEGTALTASSAWDDGNDYYFDSASGIIERLDDSWSTEKMAFLISGSYGYLDSNQKAFEDIELILTEMIAAKSGLWKTIYTNQEGSIEKVIHKITKPTEGLIKNHINYDLL